MSFTLGKKVPCNIFLFVFAHSPPDDDDAYGYRQQSIEFANIALEYFNKNNVRKFCVSNLLYLSFSPHFMLPL
jgi:hypothetical protein